MTLSEYIEANTEPILSDWEAFARSQTEPAHGLDAAALKTPAARMLHEVAAHLASRQEGRGGRPPAPRPTSSGAERIVAAARQHAAERLAQGFSLDEMILEYRVLRTAVVRGWSRHTHLERSDAIEELVRFDDALDRTTNEAIKWFYERVERGRDLLVAILAHDVRTPIGAILASADSLLADARLDAASSEAARRIRNSTLRLRHLASDLLDFTRTRLGATLPVTPSPAELGRICAATVEELQTLHPRAQLELDCRGDLQGVWDSARIEQMLSNIVANAIEHGLPGASIRIEAEATDEAHADVHVVNRGTPIPVAVQQVMLDPLTNLPSLPARETNRTRGLGLGLFIARQIAEAHGGRLRIESNEEGLTSVSVRLPRRPSPSETSA